MLKKIIYHLLVLVIVALAWNFIENKLSSVNPVLNAIKDIRFSDIYFALNDTKSSSKIYIIDIGEDKDPIKTRSKVAHFIEKINKEYKPKAIGVDIYFDIQYKDKAINQKLITALSMDNVIRMHKFGQLPTDSIPFLYGDFSILQSESNKLIYENNLKDGYLKDGYTWGLGADIQHPCIRYYQPIFENHGKKYNHFSKLIAQKYLTQSSFNNKLHEDINTEKNMSHKMMINYNIDFADNRIDINDSTRYHELKDKIILIGLNTYKDDGTPFYNDDLHFTPRNQSYIGRSAQDSYGVEILATIVSNFIENEHFCYNETFLKWLNWTLSFFIYIFLLSAFIYLNEYFVFFKLFFQTFGVFSLAIISICMLIQYNYYIDLTISIGVMFISAEIVEVVEELLEKVPNYIKKKVKNE